MAKNTKILLPAIAGLGMFFLWRQKKAIAEELPPTPPEEVPDIPNMQGPNIDTGGMLKYGMRTLYGIRMPVDGEIIDWKER